MAVGCWFVWQNFEISDRAHGCCTKDIACVCATTASTTKTGAARGARRWNNVQGGMAETQGQGQKFVAGFADS